MPTMTKIWQVTVPPGSFTSMEMTEKEIRKALPVNDWTHPMTLIKTPDGDWIFVVPSDIQTREGVKRLLHQAGIAAEVSLA